MMQSSTNWERGQFARTVNQLGLLAGNGRVSVQSLMGSGNVILLVDEFVEQPPQMTLAQHDDMVQTAPDVLLRAEY